MYRFALGLLCLAAVALAPAQAPDRGEPLPRKGALGLQLAPLTADEAKAAGVEAGIKAGSVVPGLTAEALGVKTGDVLVSLNGQPVPTPATVGPMLRTLAAGDAVRLEVVRGGERKTLSGALVARPKQKPDGFQVVYDQVVSQGKRIRVIATHPEGPGPFPTVFLIGGIGAYSVDGDFGSVAYGNVMGPIAKAGYATLRIDKPGQGDSEGPAYVDLMFDDELDAYLQALRLAKTFPFVDPKRIAIFGHSMGGAFGPIVAAQEPVAGVAVHGTMAKTWIEYWLENSRRQSLMAGQDAGELNDEMIQLAKLSTLLFVEFKPFADILKERPDLGDIARATSPDGKTMSGVNIAFFQQLAKRNLVDYWEKSDAKVLALWGECDFISTQWDHAHIADVVNRRNPGFGEYKALPKSDHGFFQTDSQLDSMQKWGRGGSVHNPSIEQTLIEWLGRTLK